MGGYSSSSGGSPGSGGTKKQAKNFAKKNKPTPIRDFITGGGITGMVIKGIKKAFDPKKNKKSKSGDVYAYDEAKEKIDYKTTPSFNTDDRNDNNNSILSTNTEATKQVASSGIVTSTGMVAPTTAEVSQATATNAVEPSATYSSDATLLANNKKGRKSTILQKAKGLGDSNLNTTKRTLGA